MSKLFARVELRGKRDRVVLMLLTEQIQSAIDLLVRFRTSAGVRKSNDFVFAMQLLHPTIFSFLRGSDVLRKLAALCGADHPETLSSTNFRKHIKSNH